VKKRIVFILAAVLVATHAPASLVPLAEIMVTGDFCTTCPFPAGPELTIDGDLNTQWHGVNDIPLGGVNILAYNFVAATELNAVDLFFINPLDIWIAGELDVQWSSNTTNGFDGTWATLASRPGDTPNNPKPIHIPFIPIETEWLRLRMEYQGIGASGVTPAFGLNEIQFHRVLEPSTLLLLGAGLLGLVRYVHRRRAAPRRYPREPLKF